MGTFLLSALAAAAISAPAYPLVSVDPYFSVWSFSDVSYETPTKHWTGMEHPLVCAVRVDGEVYRVLGSVQPRTESILPTIQFEKWDARYVMDNEPSGDWQSTDYDDSNWAEGPGAFGSKEMPLIGTVWAGNDRDIWVRRTFTLDEDLAGQPIFVEYSHDDVFELYINGIKIADTGLSWKNNIRKALPEDIKKSLKKGTKVTMAAHCHNTTGGSYVDFGLYRQTEEKTFRNPARQTSVTVLPTSTVYTYRCGGIDLEMDFTAPLLLDDLDLVSRPVNYVTWKAKSNDGKKHKVQVYFEGTPRLAIDQEIVPVVSETGNSDGISYARTGTAEQKVLGKKGDNRRIDWGYFYIASPEGKGNVSISDYYTAKKEFAASGKVSSTAKRIDTENFAKENIALSYCRDLGTVGNKTVSDYVMLAYDDIYSIQYFKNNLRPYWNREGNSSITLEMSKAAKGYNDIIERCTDFDRQMLTDARKAGGAKYADLCALSYRQAISAHKLVQSPEGDLLFLSKENFSNGSIGTVDVTYPSAPLFLLYNPELAKGLLNHIFYYSESGKWKKPFAAHDVGSYPWANGQTYGGDMPIEECGNMVILTTAIAVIEGNADYAQKHWNTLTQWTDYLVEHGQDPANQLCTDDFAGHFAHNTNLSVKAIEGIAGYARIAQMLGKEQIAERYMAKAREMASIWKETAFDGDHYRLTFDKPGTWSQKYNLVWDNMLGLNVFDKDIINTEISYYLKKFNAFGLPLDSRKEYTKTDWVIWTATMAPDMETFCKFIEPLYSFFDETEDRVPMSDWIHTDRAQHVGFQARSVVGGHFIKMLNDKLMEKGTRN